MWAIIPWAPAHMVLKIWQVMYRNGSQICIANLIMRTHLGQILQALIKDLLALSEVERGMRFIMLVGVIFLISVLFLVVISFHIYVNGIALKRLNNITVSAVR